MTDNAQNFVDFAARHGLLIDELFSDGQLHRVPTEDDKPGRRPGWYRFTGKSGCCGNWKSGGEAEHWHADGDKGMPVDSTEREIESRQRLLEQAKKKCAAAKGATRLWESAKPSDGSHPYFQAKQVKPHGLKIRGAVLLVPLYDGDNRLTTVQLIGSDGNKRFLRDGKTKGSFHVIGEPDDGSRILLCEGWATGASLYEATGLPVICAMNCGNLEKVAELFYDNHTLLVCADNDHVTHQKRGINPGVEKAMEVAKEFALRLAIPVFNEKGGGTDFNDLHVAEGLDSVRQQIDLAWQEKPIKHNLDGIVMRLARMPIEKASEEHERWTEYFTLTKAKLQQLVDRKRIDLKVTDKLTNDQVDPWHEPVAGTVLLEELRSAYHRFIYQPDHYHHVDAVCTLLSYCYDIFDFLPILLLTSPEPECGKTRKQELYNAHWHAPFRTGNSTSAVLFRAIEKYHPSILVDELDSCSEDQRQGIFNIINNGYQKGLKAHRVEAIGKKFEIVEFDCFGLKAIAAIKASTFPKATVSRSICMRMNRPPRGVRAPRFRASKYDGMDLKRKCVRWVEDHCEQLRATEVEMPEELSDRQMDIWEPLFVIAKVAGGEWPENIRSAALTLRGVNDGEVQPIGNQLLAHIHKYFKETGHDRVSSADLCKWLNELDDAGYSNWSHSKGIAQVRLAKELKNYDVFPDSIRLAEGGTKKGYLRVWFRDAFNRYLDTDVDEANQSRNNGTSSENTGQNLNFDAGTDEPCSTPKITEPAQKDGACSVVPDSTEGIPPETAADDGNADSANRNGPISEAVDNPMSQPKKAKGIGERENPEFDYEEEF